MNHTKKITIVLNFLYSNRSKSFSINELKSEIQHDISEEDFETIIEDFIDKHIVLKKQLRDVDGEVLPLFNYKLSSEGILLIEESISKKRKESNSLEKTISTIDNDINTINNVNPYPAIFKNYHAYQMFLELKLLTLNEENTKVADYAFIYHKMKQKSLMAIHSNISQRVFIDFLNDNFNAKIVVAKLPFRNPLNKQKAYSLILEKYKDDL